MAIDKRIVWPVQGWEVDDVSHTCSFSDARDLGLYIEFWNCQDVSLSTSDWRLTDSIGRRVVGRVANLVVEDLHIED